MKIYNEDKTQIIENPDLTKGYLINDIIMVNPSQSEIFHYEMKKYENAGIEKIKIIDQPHKPAEFEEIKVFILYTHEELRQNKISSLKIWFNTEYTKQEQKLRRLHTLGLKCEDGYEPIEKLKQLYREAEETRKEIQRLEQGGDENGTLYDNTL